MSDAIAIGTPVACTMLGPKLWRRAQAGDAASAQYDGEVVGVDPDGVRGTRFVTVKVLSRPYAVELPKGGPERKRGDEVAIVREGDGRYRLAGKSDKATITGNVTEVYPDGAGRAVVTDPPFAATLSIKFSEFTPVSSPTRIASEPAVKGSSDV